MLEHVWAVCAWLSKRWCKGFVFLEVYMLSLILSKVSWNSEFLCLRLSEDLKVAVSECGMVFAASVKCLELRPGPEFPSKAESGCLYSMTLSSRQNLQSLQIPHPPCSFFPLQLDENEDARFQRSPD